jgi:hypothetical protein
MMAASLIFDTGNAVNQFVLRKQVNKYTLWLFNIAMEAMAHRNRWFTH